MNDSHDDDGPEGDARDQVSPEDQDQIEQQALPLALLLDALGRNEKAVSAIMDKIHTMVKDVGSRRASLGKHTSWLIFLFLVLVVVGSGILVYFERMSDGSLTFLLGVIVGSFIQFINRFNLGGSGE